MERFTDVARQESTVHYKTVRVSGLDVFYREAGPCDAPTILLLHGFPTSSSCEQQRPRSGSRDGGEMKVRRRRTRWCTTDAMVGKG